MSDTAVGKPSKPSAIDRFLRIIEIGGNALPHPATLFAMLALLVIVLSALASWAGLSVTHPTTGAEVHAVNLMTIEGLQRILTSLVTNFTSFAPLGTVLVALIGIGVCEHSGLFGTSLRLLVLSSPRFLLTPILVFAGVMSNMASEIGYVLLVPLAGLIFQAAGRHPILGMAAAFAGVSGGYSANLLLGTIDPLLAGLSQEAARIVDPMYSVSAAANFYFMFASTFVITALGWFVTERIVAKRFPDASSQASNEEIKILSKEERRGLSYAALASLAFTALILAGTLPSDGFLRIATETDTMKSLAPFLSSIVAIIFGYGIVAGVAYGIGAGTIKSDADVIKTAYRVGDSVTNIISPMMSYFALIIAFFQRYEPKAGIGTLISVMLPYSVVFWLGWASMFAFWIFFELPVGPGSPLYYVPAAP
jgi:aminobenzoyl-glutamate transport protein